MVSVKKNVAYSVILTCSQYVVPLIVFPYVTRVLGPDNFGLVNFVDGTIDYFIILSMLGMGTLGIREIARNKHDPQALSVTFSSLVVLSFISTLIACAILTAAFFAFEALYQYPRLMAIGGLKLVFNFLLIEWFYKGLEDFRFITIRTLTVRLAYIIAVFLCVKRSADYMAYYSIVVGAVVVNALINIGYSRRATQFRLSGLQLKSMIKPFVILGCYAVMTAMYTTFNIMYLGIAAGKVEVAYYTASTKIFGIIIAMFTAFTGVMMPRLSSMLSQGMDAEFRQYIARSQGLLIAFAIPVIVAGMVLAPEIVTLISGQGYAGAITPMRIVLPLVFIIGLEQILVYQILIPFKSDRSVFINSVVGGLVGVGLNILIVGRLGAIGSSVVWVTCECVIMVLSQIAVGKVAGISFPTKAVIVNCISYIPLAAMLGLAKEMLDGTVLRLSAGVLLTVVYVCIAQALVLRNAEFLSMKSGLKRIVAKRRTQ